MKPEELRLGNYVLIKGEIKQVTMIGLYGVQCKKGDEIINAKFSTPDITPIPLTEQWLIDFGFERLDYSICGLTTFAIENERLAIMVENKLAAYDVIWWNYLGHTPLIKDNDAWELCDVETVHQLQNLYYALTGKELTK